MRLAERPKLRVSGRARSVECCSTATAAETVEAVVRRLDCHPRRYCGPFSWLVMRIAVLSDTHLRAGIDRLPQACVELAAGADLLVHAGDFSSVRALEELRELGPPVHAVHGNVDAPELRSELPERTQFQAGGARIALIHDAGPKAKRLERMRAAFPDADAVIFGHSHMPLIERRSGFAIFNPGSPTQRRRAPTRTMGLISVEGGEPAFELVALRPDSS